MSVIDITAVLGERDLDLLHRALAIAERSRRAGNHPFGALLAGPDGTVLLEAENTSRTEHDATGHAERNLMTLASRTLTPEVLRQATMYASAEPCAMCAAATYWAGVERVVYALSEAALRRHIGPHPENLTLDLPCRDVFARGQREISVAGPLIEEEALAVHAGFWER